MHLSDLEILHIRAVLLSRTDEDLAHTLDLTESMSEGTDLHEVARCIKTEAAGLFPIPEDWDGIADRYSFLRGD